MHKTSIAGDTGKLQLLHFFCRNQNPYLETSTRKWMLVATNIRVIYKAIFISLVKSPLNNFIHWYLKLKKIRQKNLQWIEISNVFYCYFTFIYVFLSLPNNWCFLLFLGNQISREREICYLISVKYYGFQFCLSLLILPVCTDR